MSRKAEQVQIRLALRCIEQDFSPNPSLPFASCKLLMPDTFIQILSPDDATLRQQVWQLREEVLRRPLGLSLRDEDLSGELEETTICALNEAGDVIGCVMLRRLGSDALKLRQMAVAPRAQGKGIGRMLLESAEQFAAKQGCRSISLHARLSALPFYEKSGYEAEGGLFTEVGIPHRLMRKFIECIAAPES